MSKKKYKILISGPRYGSTYTNRFFEEYNKKYFNAVGLQMAHNEFLCHQYFLSVDKWGTDRLFVQMCKSAGFENIEKRVKFLENLRHDGVELTYKIHARNLFQPYKKGLLIDWFDEFYKNADIYTLNRKNIFRAYLSSYVRCFMCNDLKYYHNKKHNRKDIHEDLITALKKSNFLYNQDHIEKFFYNYCFLRVLEDRPNTTNLYLEDLNDEILNDMLGINFNADIKSWSIVDYSEYIKPDILNKMHDKFLEMMESVPERVKYYKHKLASS